MQTDYESYILEVLIIVKAVWKGKLLAETDNFEILEGNYYFPPESVKKEFLKDSDAHTTCPWKGLASYYDVVIEGEVNKDAAWYYPNPKPTANKIKNYIAFWKGVEIKE
jgi:uncharacterized protein (DUF427 family)